VETVPGMEAYADLRKQMSAQRTRTEKGNPMATPEALFRVVNAENPPLHPILGSTGLPLVRTAYAARLATWEEWRAVSNAAQGELRKSTISSSLHKTST